ncbi:MAG TPA: PRC and DUF2382 domain-containing protein [Solirubrobacteraceae bacterium]|nr:PRC and DUF2382 domain-containing protein [Solirubrobacteraceae bacterium]
MPTIEDAKTWRGYDAVGPDANKLGTIEDIYLDEETGEPEWVALKTGMFGGKLSFAPLSQARQDGDTIVLPYEKDQIKNAPRVEADGALSQEEEAELYRHYGLDYSETHSETGLPAGGTDDDARFDRDQVGHDVSGPTTDDAMTRSEEELRVGTTRREAGRARLRKYVVTEDETVTVPVQREEVRVEREPITDANIDDAMDGPAISDEEHEVVLHEDEPVVETRAVPKERVRMNKDTKTEQETVTEQVRKERIDVDGDQS